MLKSDEFDPTCLFARSPDGKMVDAHVPEAVQWSAWGYCQLYGYNYYEALEIGDCESYEGFTKVILELERRRSQRLLSHIAMLQARREKSKQSEGKSNRSKGSRSRMADSRRQRRTRRSKGR